jgi:hypothetical protein
MMATPGPIPLPGLGREWPDTWQHTLDAGCPAALHP